jgi:hypothetical protein
VIFLFQGEGNGEKIDKCTYSYIAFSIEFYPPLFLTKVKRNIFFLPEWKKRITMVYYSNQDTLETDSKLY